MEPSQDRDSVSLIRLVTRQRYKFPQHLCCLRSWKGKGKARLEVGVTPSSLSPAQRGGALGRIEETEGTQRCSGGSRLPAKHQPANGACTAPGSPRAFTETFLTLFVPPGLFSLWPAQKQTLP